MPALAELSFWALALVCLGIAALITVLVVALFQWIINLINSIPGINVGSDWLHSVEGTILRALGGAFHKANGIMGASLHLLARYTDDLWHEIRSHAALIASTAELLLPIGTAIAAVRNTVRAAEAALHGIEHGVKDLRKVWNGIEARVKSLEHDWTKGIGHDLRVSLKADEKALSHLERRVIPSIRGDVATLDNELGHVLDWAKGKASLLGIGTFSLAVAAALTTLGLDWLKCKELGNVTKKRGCGLWSELDKLLGLAGLLTIGFDFREFVDASHIVANGIGDAVAGIEGSFPLTLPPLPPPE